MEGVLKDGRHGKCDILPWRDVYQILLIKLCNIGITFYVKYAALLDFSYYMSELDGFFGWG